MFQFDEDWDPEEEEDRDQREEQYRRFLLAEERAREGRRRGTKNHRKGGGNADQQTKLGEKNIIADDGKKNNKNGDNFYEDYFAVDPAQLMSASLAPIQQTAGHSISKDGQQQQQQQHHQQQQPRFLEHPQSEFIIRSRPAQLSCTALDARRIRVKCNAKWLDESRIRLEQGLDPATGHPSLRAHAEIQRAELDAWLADLGEFACQCWAFAGEEEATDGNKHRKAAAKEGGLAEEEAEDSEDEEDEEEEDEEEEADDNDDLLGPSTSKQQRPVGGVGKSGLTAGAVRSDTARIRLAYLRKHFHQVPIPQRVHEGRTVQLQCQPPDGDPKPEVFWHKDGQQLQFPDSSTDHRRQPAASSQNLIQAGDGSLILSAARLSDSGNYSCEARNMANRRVTEPAEIAVYVDGGWSPWADWEGDCNAGGSSTAALPPPPLLDCPVLQSQLAMVRGDLDAVQRVLPRQRRTRGCNNPAPLNGGTGCQGPSEEFRDCDHGCRLDGAWTQWTQWGRHCDSECRRERHRECAAPAPANGGLACSGPAQQWRNCTGQEGLPVADHCLPGTPLRPAIPAHHPLPIGHPSNHQTSQSTAASARPLFDSQLLALASLGCVAFLLLVIALLAGLLFCARRKRAQKGNAISMGGAAHCGAAGIFLDREEKLYFPGAAVAATAEDELGNVRTVLLSADQHNQLMAAESLGGGGGPSPATPGPRFFSLKPGAGHQLGLHPTVSTPPSSGGAARLAALLQSPAGSNNGNSYTLRSWRRGGGHQPLASAGDAMDVQPYASGPIGCRRQQQQQDVAGSRVALLPEYSSSSQGSNRTAHSVLRCSAMASRGGGGGCVGGGGSHLLQHAPEPPEEENNYATLYEGLGRISGGGGCLSTESMEDAEEEEEEESSGADYAFSRGSSSAGTQPIGGGGTSGAGSGCGGDPAGGAPTFVAVQVDRESTRIELRRAGAALTIGEATFPAPCTLFLSVSDDAVDRPELGDGETWLSSTVSFGACDQRPLLLDRPVVLSVEHCASLFPKQHCWLFSVWAQLDSNSSSPEAAAGGGGGLCWTRAWEEEEQRHGSKKLIDGEEEEEEFGLHLDRERWHLLTRRTGRFLLVGRQRRAHVAAQKRVHLCAYWTPPAGPAHRPAHPPPPSSSSVPATPRSMASSDHRQQQQLYDPVPMGNVQLAQLRVYCVPETAMAVESVRQQERRRMGGLLLAEADNFLLQSRGPLCCCLEQIGFPGGEGHPTGGSQYLEIPEQLHRWCSQNGLHFQLNVSGIPAAHSTALPRSLRGRLVLYQKGNAAAERQLLSFCLDADQPNPQAIGREDSELSRLSAFDSAAAGPAGLEMELALGSRFQLSPQVRAQLAHLLASGLLGEGGGGGEQGRGDWQALADKLGLQRHIPFMLGQHSPALGLLELWEALNAGSERALLDLLQTLRVLGRPDAVQLLELFLAAEQQQPMGPPPQCPAAPFCSLNVSPEESRQELRLRALSE